MMTKGKTHLTPEDFTNFLSYIPKLKTFSSSHKKTKLNPTQLQLLFKITYYCALRVSEVIKIVKADFDLEKRTLKVQSKISPLIETTIPPIIIGEISSYLQNLNSNQKLFSVSRQAIWGWAKEAGTLAGLQIFKTAKLKSVEGVDTLLFRHSYHLQMLQGGAHPRVVDLKLRAESDVGHYGNFTLEDVKEWEKEHYPEILSKDDIEKYTKWYTENYSLYEKLAETAKQVISNIVDDKGLTYHYIDARAKEVKDFTKKIQQGIYYEPEQMQDLAGVRVICYVKSEVDKVCESIEQNFEIDRTRSLDKARILGSDKMGYQSIHYIAKFPKSRTDLTDYKKFENLYFEIQVRTILQHAWAEIEHDRIYKSSKKMSKNIKRQFNLVSSILESADNEFQRLHELPEIQ